MIDRPTICGFCSCGCALYVEPNAGNVAALCPSANHPVSAGRLCIKGWNSTSSVRSSQRLRTPLIRKGESLEAASWEDALSLAASTLQRISSGSGSQSIGIIGSAKTTNEECYSLVKFARSVIGTPNVDGACRFYDASANSALLETMGVPASSVDDLDSLERAGSMLIVGANVMEQLAHVGSRIQNAAENGCRIVAADPRVSRLSPQASLFLHPHPGADLAWIRALIRTIIERDLYVKGAAQMPGFEELRTSLDAVVMSRLEATCGVDPEAVRHAAEMLANNPPLVVMFGLGVMQQADSVSIIKGLADVALLLGGSIVPLRGQNNAQGACDMGLAHEFLPGYASVTDADARRKWEKVWGCSLSGKPGMSSVDMIRACGSGDIKGLMIFGENAALSAPNTEESLAALDKAEFLAVADLYLTETAKLADVVFPACSFLEKDGTFTSIERRVQRVRKVFEPVGQSRSDLEIIADLASALGHRLEREPAKVMAEIAENIPQYKGTSYQALDKQWGRPWPANGAAPKLAPIPAGEWTQDSDYPFRLIASRINYHQQTGTMSARSPILTREYPEAFAEVNEADVARIGVKAGSMVRITSRSGAVQRRLMLSESVPAGCVHVPHFFGGDSPNMLASYECDPISGVPAYKTCAVRIEAIK